MKSKADFTQIRQALLDTLNKIIKELLTRYQIDQNDVYACVYCGNSTMISFLSGLSPEGLAEAPFSLPFNDSLVIPNDALGLSVNPYCHHQTLPLLCSFVGSDTTAVLLNIPENQHPHLIIDLGTNGELAYGFDNTWTVTSVACGPAFEGASLSCGMRNVKGAIDIIDFTEGNLNYHINDFPTAKGICGSAVIDLLAILLDEGLLHADGTLVPPHESNHPLSKHIYCDENDMRCFCLISNEENQFKGEIKLTQKDIREVQLAIAAIRTAWQMLLEENLSTEISIVLSGSFGSNIRLNSARRVGLVPDLSSDYISSLGNGAGLGVQRTLLSHEELERAKKIALNVSHLDLMHDETFNAKFISNTELKPVIISL